MKTAILGLVSAQGCTRPLCRDNGSVQQFSPFSATDPLSNFSNVLISVFVHTGLIAKLPALTGVSRQDRMSGRVGDVRERRLLMELNSCANAERRANGK